MYDNDYVGDEIACMELACEGDDNYVVELHDEMSYNIYGNEYER